MEKKWDKAMLAANSAYVSCGSFQEPQEESMIGLTWGEWQLEKAVRIVTAVAEEFANDAELARKYGLYSQNKSPSG